MDKPKSNATLSSLDPKQFVCTNPIAISSHLKGFDDLITPYMSKVSLDPEGSSTLLNFNRTPDELEKLKAVCSIENLDHEGQVPQTDDLKCLWNPNHFKDTTGQANRLHIQRAKNEWSKCRDRVQMFPYPHEESDESKGDLKPFEDVVVIVRLYKPFYGDNIVAAQIKLRCSHEIAILPHHTLADLRDKLRCTNDLGYCKPLEYPEIVVDTSVVEAYPSGFMFIENCFYNDTRHKTAIDYSETIRTWAKTKHQVDFKIAKMEDTKIAELSPRLGFPYLYQHQANCEHIIVFSDIRFLRQNEPLHSGYYPYYMSINKFHMKTCIMCQNVNANFIITECDRLPNILNYMCRSCVLAYNYKDGKKIGTFKLYPHYDINLLLHDCSFVK